MSIREPPIGVRAAAKGQGSAGRITGDRHLLGSRPEGLGPAILGHEGASIVVDIDPGLISVKKGDHVISLDTRRNAAAASPASDQISASRFARPGACGLRLVPDGQQAPSRSTRTDPSHIACSTFHAVLSEIAVAEVRGNTTRRSNKCRFWIRAQKVFRSHRSA
ncbi:MULTISPECIES: hypothetical protein [Mesorhizobium]|uniref:hypothetical protein n=1 Tax=Mesorhizobium TaxID=68287 RepID=UPI001495EAD4|nr:MULTISPECIES: hypothetical protein [Mesorhizobium]